MEGLINVGNITLVVCVVILSFYIGYVKGFNNSKKINNEISTGTTETENNHNEIPSLDIGDTIVIAGITWRKFKEDRNGNSYMLADDTYKYMEFGKTNNWRNSIIRKNLMDLGEEIRKEIGDKMVPINVHLRSLIGRINYGTCTDMVSILSYNLYYKNKVNIEKVDRWYWLCTPYDNRIIGSSKCVRYVCANGHTNECNALCTNSGSVRPFFILRAQ